MTIINIEALANLAATALASYGEHESNSDLKASLKEGGFSDTQAEQFIDRYQYVDNLENQLSGLSATLFFDTIDQKHVLAIRGTEFGGLGIFNDVLSADLMGIGATGFASEQGADLYRYWKRLITPKGQEVSYSLTEMTQLYMLENASSLILGPIIGSAAFILFQNTFNDDIGLGLVDPYEEVNVTGHSLGGHLAMLFARMFPNNTDQLVALMHPIYLVTETYDGTQTRLVQESNNTNFEAAELLSGKTKHFNQITASLAA